MAKIPPWLHITRVPRGEAPHAIREKWLGCTLALEPFEPIYQQPFTIGVISQGPAVSPGYGFSAPIARSLEIVGLSHPEARKWWELNCSWLTGFVFDSECGEIVESPFYGIKLQSTDEPAMVGLVNDLAALNGVEPWLNKVAQKAGPAWPIMLRSAISRDLVIRLGEALAHEFRSALEQLVLDDILPEDTPATILAKSGVETERDREYTKLKELGRGVLLILHTATKDIVEMEESDLKQPLTIVDLMVEQGLAKYVGNGMVQLTYPGALVAIQHEFGLLQQQARRN